MPLTIELKKATLNIIESKKDSTVVKNTITDTLIVYSSEIEHEDTLSKDSVALLDKTTFIDSNYVDGGKFRIQDSTYKEKVLLIGDSQLEGLRDPVYGYCVGNNYKLISTVIWYGSSTRDWGRTDTIDYFIKKFRPSFIIFAIGLNELFVKDLDNRKTYMNTIISKFEKYKMNYFWIGPAAWTKDKGIINTMQSVLGNLFYPSHLLTLNRAEDKRHPTRNASKIWFDSVAVYMTKMGVLNFKEKNVAIPKRKDSPLVVLSQPK